MMGPHLQPVEAVQAWLGDGVGVPLAVYGGPGVLILDRRRATPAEREFPHRLFLLVWTSPDEGRTLQIPRALGGPSLRAVVLPSHPRGTPFVRPGYHVGILAAGLHRGRPGLRQVGALPVARFVAGARRPTPEVGLFGLNVHDLARELATSDDVGSTGCTIVPRRADAHALNSMASAAFGPLDFWVIGDLDPGDY